MKSFGTLYRYLGSHKNVEEFATYLGIAIEYPNFHNPILVSMGKQLHEKGHPLTQKQIGYAQHLISQEQK